MNRRYLRITVFAGAALALFALRAQGAMRDVEERPLIADDGQKFLVTAGVLDVPTLILVGDLDARTPVENGEEIVATLSNGRLVVVENAAHEFYVFGSVPIRELLATFLRGEPVSTRRIIAPPLRFD